MLKNKYELTNYELALKARDMRVELIKTLANAKSGHSGAPLGTADIFACLYFNIMRYDPQNPTNDERDRFVLSCGHYCPIMYVSMAYAGFFPVEELRTLRAINSRLQGHPHNLSLPGIENSSGPLGQGISQAVGMALRAKMDKRDYRVFCLCSDGENQEGQFWEALLFASAHKLDNLYIIVDKNNIEIDGFVQDILPLEPLDRKYGAFNHDVFQMNGNSVDDIIYILNKSFETAQNSRPKIISAQTILGYGVPFMENNYEWHGKPPSAEEAEAAIRAILSVHI